MAKIIDNENGRRLIQVSSDDVISLVREYQTLTKNTRDYKQVRDILNSNCFYLPEEC